MWYNSSKKHDPYCDNLCVDVSAHVKDGNLDPLKEKCGLSEMEVFIKFKHYISNNLFRNKPLPKGVFVYNTRSSKGILGQKSFYAAVVLRIQFCIHLYLILIWSKYTWLVCWEHDHAVVTEYFNYQSSKNSLTEFIWQYAQLDTIQ